MKIFDQCSLFPVNRITNEGITLSISISAKVLVTETTDAGSTQFPPKPA
jgi:hypothetical protein